MTHPSTLLADLAELGFFVRARPPAEHPGQILALFVTTAAVAAGVHPDYMGLGPVPAMQ